MKIRISKVFCQYLRRFIIIAVSCCLLISVYFLIAANETAEEHQRELLLKKISIISQDLDILDTAMRRLSTEISVLPEFNPNYWKKQEFRQIQLLKTLFGFSPRSIMTDQFFLAYHDCNYIFKSSGEKTYRYIYANLNGIPAEDLDTVIDCSEDETVYILPDKSVLLVYPICASFYTRINGVLCFRISEEQLTHRIRLIIGELPACLNISIDNHSVYGDSGKDHSEKVSSGRFSVSAVPNTVHFSESVSMNAPIIILIFTFILATLFAYQTYFPLMELKKKYSPHGGRNEIEEIDILLNSLLSKNENMSQNMAMQNNTLKSQLLEMLLEGYFNEFLRDSLRIVGVTMDHCKITLFTIENIPADTSVISLIEAMSDQQIALHALYRDRDDCIIVFAVMDESEQPDDARSLIESLMENYERASVRCIGTADCYEKIADLYLNRTSKISATDFRKYFDCLLESMEKREWNTSKELIIDIKRQSDVTIEKDDLLRISAQIIQIGKNLQLPMENTRIFDLILVSDISIFIDIVYEIILQWAHNDEQNAPQPESKLGDEVLQYIQNNYMNSELSLDMMSSVFGVSINTLYRVIKQKTGIAYREYLINLRITKAKEILIAEAKTITEIAADVGYTNLSYFIKSFKAISGMTPVQFRTASRSSPASAKDDFPAL